MKADLYKRLFKAIFCEDIIALKKIADIIIAEEKKLNHLKLVESLERIKYSERPTPEKNHIGNHTGSMSTLPKSNRNNIQLVTEIPREQLKHNMILNDTTEQRLLCIEKEYAAKDRLSKYNLKPKRKILFYGEPGCGKTMAAERIAWNLGLPLLKVRFDSLLSSYFGESASNLRTVFDYCAQRPVVLLLDECDFIAKSRNTTQDVGEVPRIVNMLLTLLDEYNAPGLVIATTNLKISLDEALFRRFDDIIEIHKPTNKEIIMLLKTNLSAIKTSNDIDWNFLSERLDGQSAASIVSIVQNAAKKSILEGSSILSQGCIIDIIEEMSSK